MPEDDVRARIDMHFDALRPHPRLELIHVFEWGGTICTTSVFMRSAPRTRTAKTRRETFLVFQDLHREFEQGQPYAQAAFDHLVARGWKPKTRAWVTEEMDRKADPGGWAASGTVIITYTFNRGTLI